MRHYIAAYYVKVYSLNCGIIMVFIPQDSVGGYTCECVVGFTDDVCGTNIDDCLESDCQNNAQCIVSLYNWLVQSFPCVV